MVVFDVLAISCTGVANKKRKKKSFPSRDFVDNICMVKTDVEGHDLVILRCFSVAYQGRVFTKKTV